MINQNKNNKNKICGVLVFLFVFYGLFFGINTLAADCSDYNNKTSCESGPDCSWIALTNKEYCRSTLEIDWPKSPMGTQLDSKSGISVVVKYLYEWGIGLGGIAAFISLIMAGFQYVSSAGDSNKMKDARDNINSTLGGLLLLLSSFLVLNTINPQLVFLQKPEDIKMGTGWPEYNITLEEQTLESCEGVKIYQNETCDGSYSAIIKPGGKETVTSPRAIKSLEGYCTVNFYTSSDCSFGSSGTISVAKNNCFPISSFPTTDPIRCISVEGNVSYEIACHNDCTRCTGEEECADSMLGSCCWYDGACSECFGEDLDCGVDTCGACEYLECYQDIITDSCQWNDMTGKCMPRF